MVDDRQALGDEARRVLHAGIGAVGDDDALPRPPAQRAQHRIRARRGVVDKSQSLRHGADEARQPFARRQQRPRQLIHHEAHRLALHRLAPARLRRQHMPRRGTEGTVVEEADAGVERPEAAQGVAEGGVGWGEQAGAHGFPAASLNSRQSPRNKAQACRISRPD